MYKKIHIKNAIYFVNHDVQNVPAILLKLHWLPRLNFKTMTSASWSDSSKDRGQIERQTVSILLISSLRAMKIWFLVKGKYSWYFISIYIINRILHWESRCLPPYSHQVYCWSIRNRKIHYWTQQCTKKGVKGGGGGSYAPICTDIKKPVEITHHED